MRRLRRIVVSLALLTLFLDKKELAASDPSPPPQPAQAPNVVLIVIDDLGWRDLGCYGSTFYKTPHIDQLAREGLRFTQFYAASPVCSPTRASILTGRYPVRVNITDWIPGRKDQPDRRLKRPAIRDALPLNELTIAEALQARGYITGHIGKWHLGGPGFLPQDQGFDVNIAGGANNVPFDYFAPYKNAQGQVMVGLEKSEAGEYLTDRLAREAEKFLDQYHDKPFFLYWPHYAVHRPLQAKPDVIAKYPNAPQAGRQSNPVYAAMIESVDDAVGRLVKKLDDLKLTEQTLVIFTSDNGGLATIDGGPTGATFNGPLREGKGYLYEGGIRVPCIMKWPGHIRPATTTDDISGTIDLFDTILEVTQPAAKRTPEQPSPPRDGVSLVPLFRGKKLPDRDLFWHYPHYSNQGGKPCSAIRHGDYKLIRHYENDRFELFNIATDISEHRNLVAEKPAIVRELSDKLAAWLKAVEAPMPTPNPHYRPNPPNQDGIITLPASTALIAGVQLRYEPLPHKATLGFWTNPDDIAIFDFTVEKPGRYTVEVLQGCGKGSGGAQVELVVGAEKLTFTVKDTGGFQNFEAIEVGTLTIAKAGRHTLKVIPKSKPGRAVMDLRQIVLKPLQ
ncbi:MAG: sulfatase-like hydrolase/transferase [Gemmataceae bacterium]|nr:sulfatase-like hydrolase/transferase [Gemmata sp.]MDW8198238.1 sulfatase-like hydrolase/transferase [Gemmataceae bacterium]